MDYVFLHGGLQGGWVWEETIAALRLQGGAAVGRTMALDIPGCGTKRDRADDSLDSDAIAAGLVGEIEAAGLRDVLLVGHSQAGTVLPRMIERAPALFRRVVYVSCVAPLPGQTVFDSRDAEAALDGAGEALREVDPAGGNPDALYRTLFCNDMTEAQATAFLAKLGRDTWPWRMHEVSDWRYDRLGAVPASYVLCLRDEALIPSWQMRFAERLGAGRVVRIDAGHQVQNSRPHALAKILLREV